MYAWLSTTVQPPAGDCIATAECARSASGAPLLSVLVAFEPDSRRASPWTGSSILHGMRAASQNRLAAADRLVRRVSPGVSRRSALSRRLGQQAQRAEEEDSSVRNSGAS